MARFVSVVAAVFFAIVAAHFGSSVCSGAEPTPLESVRPLIGTAEHGHTYPGATVPFGMVQLSPDTRLTSWDGCSGYHYTDSAILGFSHTHLSGTGCKDLFDIRFTPLSGKIPKMKKDGYHCRFSHDDETASPGYYRVTLQDPKIEVELTATAHAGFHKYTFPKDDIARLAVDLERGGDRVIESALEVEGKTTISGYRRSKGWAKDHTYFFVAEFSRPFDAWTIDVDGKPVADGVREAKGVGVQARFDFNDPTEPVLVKVGISAVSVEGARKNLAAEIPAWDFQATVAAAAKSWSEVLNKIEIQTNDPALRETFYTAIYHSCVAPTLFNDADGTYTGLDHKTHKYEGFQNYSTFSLWDTFRAEHPLLTIIQPQRIDDFIASMLAHYRQFNKHVLPVWSLAGCETWCMIGNHAIPVIAEAYAKGFRRYDVETAYQAMRDSAMLDRKSMKEYRERGYLATSKDANERKQSVSTTLEYAYDDWCVGQMAKQLGKKDDAALFFKGSENYRNLFNPAVGFMCGRYEDGTWREPFNPRELVLADYTEATSWNYTWCVMQDVSGLVQLMGGDEKCIAKLDLMFTETSGVLAKIRDLTGLIGQYVHGNEPCHHVPYIYNYAGAPWKTQERVRQIMKTLYDNTPGGICGNDDCGQTSAWYVLSAMGFYSVNPASGVYVLGSPVFDKVTINLDPKYQKGGKFSIVAENNSPTNVYIQSATLNGKPLTRSWISHTELVSGGELVLKMGPKPNTAWGQRPEDRPPVTSFTE